jgi:tetratricopeptide (TPR) repeat protein
VYPAGPAEDREFNRVSAERRAAYLGGRHGTITHVVADVDITADERKAHLLVLGWNNLLLQEAEAVALTANGWRFQDIERGFSHDLLFGWISPFSQPHEFFFWSRIDPELDRYLILPFFGSDWIVYDRYTVEQFGRFHNDKLEWPPRRNLDVQIDNRTLRPRPAPKRESEHYVLYDVSLGLSEAEIEKILQAREEAWNTVVSALGVAPEKPIKIKLYVYEDSEAKELFCDVADARHHLPKRAEFHTTKVIALDRNLHEDVHLIARQAYGPGYLSLLVEGLAVWAEQQQGANELPVYAAMLVDRVDLPGIAGLLDEETMRVLVRNRIGFAVAGLFVAWLRAEIGPDAVRRVYGQYESDASLFARTIDLSVEEIDTRFAAFIGKQAATGKTETLFRDATAKARHYGGLGDYEQAIPALERALELRPADLVTRYSLAVAHLKLDDLKVAEMELGKILEIHREAPNDELALAAWYQLGELHSKRGEHEKARKAYEKVLELPDYRGMHGRTRDALAEIGGSGANADAP